MRFFPVAGRLGSLNFLLAGLTAGLLMSSNAHAQLGLEVLTSESEVAIVGRSNLNEFICKADKVEGSGRLESKSTAEPVAQVEIPVEAFDCRNGRMNRDLFDALKGEQHPYISYRLDGVRVLDRKLDNGAALLEAEGTIWVAGVARSVRTRVVGDRLANGYLRATGSLDLSMSDFNIDPPTAMLGLVKVRDGITVRFELTAEPVTDLTGGPSETAAGTSAVLGAVRR